jgi:hypothetical protein
MIKQKIEGELMFIFKDREKSQGNARPLHSQCTSIYIKNVFKFSSIYQGQNVKEPTEFKLSTIKNIAEIEITSLQHIAPFEVISSPHSKSSSTGLLVGGL